MTLTLNFEGQLKKYIICLSVFLFIGIRGWIDMELKGRESIGCRTQVVTLNFDLTHDLKHGFPMSNF